MKNPYPALRRYEELKEAGALLAKLLDDVTPATCAEADRIADALTAWDNLLDQQQRGIK